jgi:hypothetical protein
MKTMKLKSTKRQRLRSALRAHPDVAKFVNTGAEIAEMSDEQMLELADRMDLNVEAATKYPHPIDLDRALQDYSMAHPAFEGHIEIDLVINLLGLTVQRRARLAFTDTPDWKYFDTEQGNERLGWESRSVAIEVLAAPDNEAWVLTEKLDVVKASNEPRWIALDLGDRGVLPSAVWAEIDRLIDEHCLKEDERRRGVIAE